MYLFFLCPSLGINKINEQGSGLARKGHGNAKVLKVRETRFQT